MKLNSGIAAAIVLSIAVAGVTACEKGTAERAAEKIGDTAEKVGEKIDDTVEQVGEKVEDTGEKMKKAAKDATK